jgi:putative aldouronate transport system substrate-binding protein
MYKFSKACTLLLAVLFAMTSLAGCGSQQAGSPDTTATAAAVESSAGPTETAKAAETVDQMGKYEPGIEIHLVATADDTFIKNAEKNGMSFDKNIWTDTIQDMFGIKVVYDWIAKSGDEANTKMDLAIASGDLPDMFYFGADRMVKVKQLVNADMLADLTDAYDKYATGLTKEYMNMGGENVFTSSTYDGKLMAIPYMFGGAEDSTDTNVWVREDWMKKLGLSEPQTMEDILKIMEAFSTQDPDGNSKVDTIGMTATKDLWGTVQGLDGFFNSYHSYPTIWVDDGTGKLVYGGIQPVALKALSALKDLYKKGYLDNEFGIKSSDKANEMLVGNKAGVTFGASWIPVWPLFQGHDADNSVSWKPYRLMSVDDQPAKPQIGSGINGYYVVNKNYKNPEAVIKMLNLWYEKVYGPNNEYGKYSNPPGDANWEVWKYAPISNLMNNKNYRYTLQVVDALKNGDTSVLMNNEAIDYYTKVDSYLNKGNQANWSWATIFGPNGSYDTNRAYYDNNLFQQDAFLTAPTKTMETKWSTLQTMQKEAYLKIILGGTDSDFDDFVKNFNTLGGEQITKEVNEWYASARK